MSDLSYMRCCEIIRAHCPDEHAKAYASVSERELERAALQQGKTLDDAFRVQALYILSNIERWKHPQSTVVRAALKRIGGVK